jgi:hypothetical protein
MTVHNSSPTQPIARYCSGKSERWVKIIRVRENLLHFFESDASFLAIYHIRHLFALWTLIQQ